MTKPFAFWGLLLLAELACGCRQHATQAGVNPPANADQPQPAAETADAGPPLHGPGTMIANPPPAVIPEQAASGATLSQLSLELRKYVVRTRSAPKNFEEFVALSHLQAPSPPPGKKYAIEGGAVVLTKL